MTVGEPPKYAVKRGKKIRRREKTIAIVRVQNAAGTIYCTKQKNLKH